MAMQVKLLRVLQERTVRPVGSTSEISIDVRVIAATNRDLDKAVAENAFARIFYYRLNVIPIRVPPLRERREDIPLLVNHFLKKYASAAGRSILRVHAPSLDSCVATSGRATFASWKTLWSAQLRLKRPMNCTCSFPLNDPGTCRGGLRWYWNSGNLWRCGSSRRHRDGKLRGRH